ncbi:MAG: 50S ribosomal protein L1, partial [Patescibacteria group bacterium]
SKTYGLKDALELLSKFQKTKFDETIELHLNTVRSGISGTLTLPHGTGKTTRVAIADEAMLAEIETGKINFDILVATPDMMPKLAKVAKILGPKGLMPNPKNGTITAKPEEVVKKFEGGQISFKTEAKAPLIHMTVGKFSFGDKKLTDNITAAVGAIKIENIAKITLKSTMSPGIRVQI